MGFIEPVIRSTRFGHYYFHHQELETTQIVQRVVPHLGYGWLLVWCMGVGLSVRVEGCCSSG
jgi:hypothetical protein